MDKTAQKRGPLTKLRENVFNPTGIAAEKFFNPEFKKVLKDLREKDDQIRAIVTGEKIGDAEAPSDPTPMKALLKSAKSNFNRREYMSAIAELGRFHKKIFDIVQIINKLNANVDEVHHEFLYKDLSDESKQHLQDLKTRFAEAQQNALIKEASIMDFFYNIGTKRGRALALWEKRYPKKTAKLKSDTTKLLDKSESLFDGVLSALKQMASARSVRNVDEYVKAAGKISAGYAVYDKGFKVYYDENVKGLLADISLISPTKSTTDSTELGNKDVPVEKETHKIKTDFGPDIETGISVAPPKAKGPEFLSMPPAPTLNDPGTVKPKTPFQAPLPQAFEKPVAPAPGPSSAFAPTMHSPSDGAVGVPAIPKAAPVPTDLTMPLSAAPPTDPSPAPSFTPSEPPTEQRSKSEQIAKEYGWAHVNFLETLESLSGEHPAILAGVISKYANKIKAKDPKTAIKLLNVVKRIRG